MEEQQIKAFYDNCRLKSLKRQPACYKPPSNPNCIDLILTKAPQTFQSSCVLETGLSDFHSKTDVKTTEVLNKFLSNNFKNLEASK